jgi:hypothetical protein
MGDQILQQFGIVFCPYMIISFSSKNPQLTYFTSFAGSGFPASQDRPQSLLAAYNDICIQVGLLFTCRAF